MALSNTGGLATFSFVDYDGETSSTTVITTGGTSVNLTQKAVDMNLLVAAIEGLILGEVTKTEYRALQTALSSTLPTDVNAQRERKYLVTYTDTTEFLDAPTNAIPNPGFGKKFNIELPCADLSQLQAGKDTVDITTGAGATFKTAFETLARTPYGGVPSVVSIKHIGKNT